MSVSGDTAAIGAYVAKDFDEDIDDRKSGLAYVFSYDGSTWVQREKLTNNDGAADDAFGCSVSVSGDTVMVGAYWDDGNASESGSVYEFTLD